MALGSNILENVGKEDHILGAEPTFRQHLPSLHRIVLSSRTCQVAPAFYISSVLRKIPFIKPMTPTLAKTPPTGCSAELEHRGRLLEVIRDGRHGRAILMQEPS